MQPLNRTQQLHIQGRTRPPSVWRTPSIVFGGFGLAALVAVEFTEYDDWYVLGWVCALALAYAIVILRRGFRDGPMRVLTDPFLVLVCAFALYFLFGTLLLVIGPEDQVSYALQGYPTTAQDAVRVTALNLLGLAALLFTAGFFPGERIEKFAQPVIAFFGKLQIRKVFWLFLIIGVSAKLLVIAVDIEATGDEVVLGIIRALAGVAQIAILIGIFYQGRNAGIIHITAILFALADSVAGLLLFNKSAVLIPVLVILLGLYLRRPSIKLVIVSVAILVTILLELVNPIGDARSMLGVSGDKSVSARLQILKEVFGANASPHHGSGTWSRLCYTVSQVAAVDLYENNQGGDDVELLAWVFVPRALFPSKPIITRSGTDFNRKVTGSDQSSTGMGLFISGYYNGGWIALFVVSALAGWILSVFAAISRAIVASRSVIMLPVSLIGSFMAFRIDGHFVADYLGTFAMVMVPFLTILFMLRVGAPKTTDGRVR